jgi:hypothetical protein
MLPGFKSRWRTPPAVGIVDGVTDIEKPPQQLQERQVSLAGVAAFLLGHVKLLDGRLEVVAADEPHRIEGAAVVICPQSVDRHNAGVLEPAGDLGLHDKPGSLVFVCGLVEFDAFERNHPVQLLVAGDVDLTERTTVVEADNTEAAVGVGGRAFLVPIRSALAVGVFVCIRAREAEVKKAGLDVEVGEFLEVVADCGTYGQDGQAALGIETVLLEVLLDQDL